MKRKEKVKFIQASDREFSSAETLGTVSKDNQETYCSTINGIRNLLMIDEFNRLSTELLEKKNYPQSLCPRLVDLLRRHFSGTGRKLTELRNKLIDKPLMFDYKSCKPFSVSSITDYYSKYLPEVFFDAIPTIADSGRHGGVGRGEILLGLFTQLQCSEKGDLQNGNVKIEIKGYYGAFATSGTSCFGVPGERAKTRILEVISSHLNLSSPVIQEFMSGILAARGGIGKTSLGFLFDLLTWVKEEQILPSNSKFHEELVTSLINYSDMIAGGHQVRILKSIIESDDKDTFYNFCLALHFDAYRRHENFDYIVFFNKDYSRCISYPAMEGFTDVMRFFTENTSTFGSWRSRQSYAVIVNI